MVRSSDVGAARDEPFDLLGEGGDRGLVGEPPSGANNSPVGPTEPATTTGGRRVGDPGGDRRRRLGELEHPVLSVCSPAGCGCSRTCW